MPEWKKIVGEKLGSLPLARGQREEVIEELAGQLESAYEEALAQGSSEQEALRRSLAQFKDWEKLRGELFHSVAGRALPVWQQNGIFSPRRVPVWVALTLALLFLASPVCRQALAVLPVPGSDPTAWTSRTFSDATLRRLELSGDQQKYARALAFVALYSPKEDDLRAMHAAEKAVAIDPQLTWIYAKVSHATYMIPGYDPHPWVAGLEAWDPENAFPYLLEASASIYSETQAGKYNLVTPAARRVALAGEPRWRVPMEKAFRAPRMDAYGERQFALARQVLQEEGLNRPDILILCAWSQPLPDYLSIRNYAEFLMQEVGASAEKAGRPEDALAAYRSVVRFSEKLRADKTAYFSGSLANMLLKESYEKMLPLLRHEGRKEEATAAEVALSALDAAKSRGALFSAERTEQRSARLVAFSALAVMLFGSVTAVWLIFLLVLKWKPHLNQGIDRLASAFSAAPSLLLLACSALFLGYYPYAGPIAQYASSEDLHTAFLMSLYGALDTQFTDIWLVRMFWPLVWCAVIALAGAVLLWFAARRQRSDQTGAV